MEYRIHKRTRDKISVLGMGTGYIADIGAKAPDVIRRAYEGGINYYDLAAAKAAAFSHIREALSDVRSNVFYQIHFGADYANGDYGWTTDSDTVRRSIDFQLRELKTDYIDYGFIHCLDELSDWKHYQKNGTFRLLMDMKEQGVVRHIGLSSHTPAAIQKILDDAPVDMLMFSVNAAYDYQKGTYGKGSVDERSAVYRRCETEGIGITVMKPFAGGQLLDSRQSPFGTALTHYQCVQYALDRPGVLAVLPGISNAEQLRHLLGFFEASQEEKDYSAIATFKPADAAGKCVYCNHCQPCPAGLDVGIINKFYDLAAHGDDMAAEHYKALSKHADDCIRCGHCNDRCPFGVDQSERMAEIAKYFK